jgi:glutaconate CoA-transferase, subunit B
MRLRALQAGVTVGQVRKQTGFDLLVGDDLVELAPPSAEELAIYRELRDGPAAAVAHPGERVSAGPG